jgi:exodeoxyribonuclease V gamma subunit
MSGSRFDPNRVLALLEIQAVQRRFGFADSDLLLVRRWVKETGIRWGIDQNSRSALDLPATREHTWRAGLDRLLLGYALPGGNSRLLGDILPYDEVEGGDTQIMGRLHTFTEALFQLNVELAVRQSLTGWFKTLSNILERFLEPVVGEEKQLQMIHTALEKISRPAGQARYTESVSLAVVQSCLRGQLETAEGSAGRFITGGVTFSAMVPMRSIPFQVVCLIGMNSTNYPRPRRSLGFDLMARNFRRGDRSRRNDDRYLFLEALLSARRCFYLSFVGNDIRDNSPLPPSVLVSELLD